MAEWGRVYCTKNQDTTDLGATPLLISWAPAKVYSPLIELKAWPKKLLTTVGSQFLLDLELAESSNECIIYRLNKIMDINKEIIIKIIISKP